MSYPQQPHSRFSDSAASHAQTPPLPFHRPGRGTFLHRRNRRRRRLDISVRGEEPNRGELSHRRRRLLFHMGYFLAVAEAVQLRIGADGAGAGEILQHELQPFQRPGIRRGSEQVVEDPGSDEEVPAVSEPGGEQREAAAGGGGGEEQAERAQEPAPLGAAALRDGVGGDGEDAAPALSSVRRCRFCRRLSLRWPRRVRIHLRSGHRQSLALRHGQEDVALGSSLSVHPRWWSTAWFCLRAQACYPRDPASRSPHSSVSDFQRLVGQCHRKIGGCTFCLHCTVVAN